MKKYEDLLQAMSDFRNSYNALCLAVADYENATGTSVNDIKGFVESYPFDKSLDELAIDQWVGHTTESFSGVKFKVLNYEYIATKNIPQGISAAMNFDPSLDVETNVANMENAMKQVRSGQITHAVRDTEMDGIELHNGDVIGLYEKTIVASGQDVNEVAKTVIEKMADDSTAAITLYYGAGLTESVARELEEELIENYPFHDIIVCEGGQHHYFYFISVE